MTKTAATKNGKVAVKKPKNKFVIEGSEGFDPFGGFKNLLHFCDPRKIDDEDATVLSHASIPDLGSQQPPLIEVQTVVVEENEVEVEVVTGLTYGLNTTEDDDDKPDPPSEHGSEEIPAPPAVKKQEKVQKEIKTRELPPELKATHTGSKLRIRRGIEVTIYAFLAVCGTLFLLHKLGYETISDFSVIESSQFRTTEPKKLINIAYNDKASQNRNVAIQVPKVDTKPSTVGDNARLKELIQDLNELVDEIKTEAK